MQKFGGNLASNGSTTHFFDNLGVIQFSKDEISDEKALDIAATVGAKDCLNHKDFHEIITIKEDFYKVKNQIEKFIKNFNYSGIEWRSQNKVSINKKDEKEILNSIEIHFVDSANEILKKAFTSKILPYKPPTDKIGIPEKSLNPKENTIRH